MMKDDPGETQEACKEPQCEKGFVDPGRKPWVWTVFIFLIAAMLPVWPVSGTLWGLPAWAVFAVFVSALTSAFIAYVVIFVWRDNDEGGRNK